MRILLINQAFHPDKVATAQYLTDLAIALNDLGCKVTVVASRFCYKDMKTIYHISEEYKGISVRRAGSLVILRGSKFARIFNAVSINISFFLLLLKLPKQDAILGMTSPPFVAFFASLIAKVKRVPFYYWIMDLNPDQIIKAGWLRKRSIAAKLLKLFHKFVVNSSQKIIVLDEEMKSRLLKRGADENKMHISPLWGFKDIVRSQRMQDSRNFLRSDINLENKFVIMYSGNHSICHPLSTLLDAALSMRERSDVVFVFVGDGELVNLIQKFKNDNNLNNIIQSQPTERKNLSSLLSLADIQVITMGDRYAGIVHPCKIYNILAINTPFIYIGPKNSFIGRLVRDDKIGYQIDHGDWRGVERCIEDVRMMSSEELVAYRKKIRNVANRYSYESRVPIMTNILVDGDR